MYLRNGNPLRDSFSMKQMRSEQRGGKDQKKMCRLHPLIEKEADLKSCTLMAAISIPV